MTIFWNGEDDNFPCPELSFTLDLAENGGGDVAPTGDWDFANRSNGLVCFTGDAAFGDDTVGDSGAEN